MSATCQELCWAQGYNGDHNRSGSCSPRPCTPVGKTDKKMGIHIKKILLQRVMRVKLEFKGKAETGTKTESEGAGRPL